MKIIKVNAADITKAATETATEPVVIDTRAIAARLKKKAQAEVGIYYVLRYPRSWGLFALPENAFGDLRHIGAWRTILVTELADAWADALNVDPSELSQKLMPCHFAFPRGRIERVAINEFTVFQADDLAPTGVSHAKIEQAFTLLNANWTFDPHERCRTDHKEAVRQILGITEDWASA